MLGAVGAYDWNGTVVMQKANQMVIPHNTTFQTEPAKMNEPLASYLGKSWAQPWCLHKSSFRWTKTPDSGTLGKAPTNTECLCCAEHIKQIKK